MCEIRKISDDEELREETRTVYIVLGGKRLESGFLKENKETDGEY
jgi:hypothetical protein